MLKKNNNGEKMKKKWSKETISKAREITKKHLVNSDPKLFTDKTINEILNLVELANKLKRERA
tara:strand:- start:321 stop:509 length:189 start_codon:yes stop_codon:yes gene_type:complete